MKDYLNIEIRNFGLFTVSLPYELVEILHCCLTESLTELMNLREYNLQRETKVES